MPKGVIAIADLSHSLVLIQKDTARKSQVFADKIQLRLLEDVLREASMITISDAGSPIAILLEWMA